MRKFLLLALLLLPAVAGADISVSWVNADHYTDGTVMPASDLASTTAWCGTSLSALTLHTTVTAPATMAVVTGTAPGTPYVCVAAHTTKSGATSDFTNSVTVTGPALKPNPPSGIGATLAAIGPTAYTLIKTKDRLAALPVGTIPIGTPCDVNQPVLGLYVVPVASVTWSGTVRTLAVLGSCA